MYKFLALLALVVTTTAQTTSTPPDTTSTPPDTTSTAQESTSTATTAGPTSTTVVTIQDSTTPPPSTTSTTSVPDTTSTTTESGGGGDGDCDSCASAELVSEGGFADEWSRYIGTWDKKGLYNGKAFYQCISDCEGLDDQLVS